MSMKELARMTAENERRRATKEKACAGISTEQLEAGRRDCADPCTLGDQCPCHQAGYTAGQEAGYEEP